MTDNIAFMVSDFGSYNGGALKELAVFVGSEVAEVFTVYERDGGTTGAWSPFQKGMTAEAAKANAMQYLTPEPGLCLCGQPNGYHTKSAACSVQGKIQEINLEEACALMEGSDLKDNFSIFLVHQGIW